MKSHMLSVVITVSLLIGYASGSQAANDGAKLYRTECSSCHVAYPSAFLSAASWKAVMGKLDQHFGDNAELAAGDLSLVSSFLEANSYDQSSIKRRYKDRFDTPGTPLRVTKTRFFQAIHDELPSRLVGPNAKVKTFARCEACHTRAQKGSFDEDEVRVPR